MNRQEFLAIVESGIRAPSADNRHLIRFESLERGIAVWPDDEFRCAEIHRQVMGLISCGAVLENMRLRAESLGYSTKVDSLPQGLGEGPLAVMHLEAGVGKNDRLVDAIPERHTNRRFFTGPGLSPQQRLAIESELTGVPEVRLVWLDDHDIRKAALELILAAESARFNSEALHRDLFDSIRFDVGWHRTTEEHLAPGALEIEAPLRPLFAALRSWRIMRALNLFGMHRVIGLRGAYLPSATAPHLGVLGTATPLPIGALIAGRAFERVWLRTQALGFALQPLAASAIMSLDGYRGVPSPLRLRLTAGWKNIIGDMMPLMVFRLGRAKPASLRAARPSAIRFLKE